MRVFYKGREREIDARKVSCLGKYKGLMFTSRKHENLLFSFPKAGKYGIHSYFVFYPFLAVWMDSEFNVTETMIVRPFRAIIKPEKSFNHLLELPLNDKNKSIVGFFVGKGKI